MPAAIGAAVLTAVGASATATVAGVSLAAVVGNVIILGAVLGRQTAMVRQ